MWLSTEYVRVLLRTMDLPAAAMVSVQCHCGGQAVRCSGQQDAEVDLI